MGLNSVRIDSQLFYNAWAEETPLTVTSVGTAGNVEAVVAAKQWNKYTGTYREARPSSGVFTQADYKITFSAATFTAFPVKPGDRLFWEGLESPAVVLQAAVNDLLRYWELQVRDLVLAYDLRQTATISRPTVSADASGLRSASFAAVYEDVPCRMQPDGWEQESDTDGRVLRRQRYQVFVGTTTAVPSVWIKAGDVLDVDGVRYEIVGESVVTALDTLTTLTAKRFDPAG